MSDDPQGATDRRMAARLLVQSPLTCSERQPEAFRLIRRHELELDRWFTQRLGYRLHVDADTARLFKTGVLCDRPLRTGSGRPFHQREYVLLALVLASTAAGPAVISLLDLVDLVRSAAAEAEVSVTDDATGRRALVTVLRWMIDRGLATELHAHVDQYASDGTADAVLKLRPDRIALVPLPALVNAADADELLERAERRGATRQWIRARLVEDPVVYRDDLNDEEWGEFRRRLGEEERILDECFGLVLEARAEGVAAIDPTGTLADRRFPAGGTVGHAALLLIDRLRTSAPVVAESDVVRIVADLCDANRSRWSNDYVDSPELLARHALDLLAEIRLIERRTDVGDGGDLVDVVRMLPAAARFMPAEPDSDIETADAQDTLW